MTVLTALAEFPSNAAPDHSLITAIQILIPAFPRSSGILAVTADYLDPSYYRSAADHTP